MPRNGLVVFDGGEDASPDHAPGDEGHDAGGFETTVGGGGDGGGDVGGPGAFGNHGPGAEDGEEKSL